MNPMSNLGRIISSLFAAIFLALHFSLMAQNFPLPGSLNEFSDVMVEQPDTAMVIVPGEPSDAYTDESVTADPSSTPPQSPYSPDLPETGDTYEGPVGVTGIFNGNVTTGCSYDPVSHSAHRVIDDIVVPGSIGKYPLKMTRYYNTRQQYYAAPGAIGLSPGWSHEYSWLLWSAGHKMVSPHGNVYDDFAGPPVGVSEGWDPDPSPTPPPPNVRVWRLADGGRVVFTGGRVTDIYDPYGLRTRIAYNAGGERVKVTEPGGRCLWFIYGTRNQGNGWGDGTWLLTRVEAYGSDGSPGSPTHPNGNLTDSVDYSYDWVDPLNPSPTPPGPRSQKMLTGVTYSDGTQASYWYRTDNVHEGGGSSKRYPLLRRCNDVRYNGPMRTIVYHYQNAFPHGFVIDETNPSIEHIVSAISPNPTQPDDTFIETRGDTPTRSFTYTQLWHCPPPDPQEPCDVRTEYGENDLYPFRAPNQMLKSYTDFQGNSTQLHYDPNWYIDSVTDANGHKTDYDRGPKPPDGIGEIKRIIPPGGSYPNGFYIEYIYSDHGHYIMSVKDENNNLTSITRDARHRITQINYPNDPNTPASFEAFTYCDQADQQCNNTLGQIKRHRLKNGAFVHYKYDPRGLLTDKWEPTWNDTAIEEDPKTHYDYYTSGGWTDRVRTMTMPPNFPSLYSASETYEYDMAGNNRAAGRGLITKITYVSPTSGIYRSFRYDQYGNKVDEWNELGENTHYIYDNYNRLTSVSRGGETTSYRYNPTNGGSSPYLHTTNNPDLITSPTGIATNIDYDANFRKTWSSIAGRTTWFHYDLVGNLQCVTDPRGSGECPSPNTQCAYTTRTEYDRRNRKWHVWDAQNNQTTFTYDNASNITRIDRPNGNWEQKAYDAVNRVIRDTVSFTAGSSLETWLAYNPSGTIQEVVDPRGTVGQTYPNGDPLYTTRLFYNDPADQRTAMFYPPIDGNADVQRWGYDQAHNLIWHLFPSGQKAFAYDQRNRKCAELWNFDNDYRWYYFGFDDVSRVRDAKTGSGDFDYSKTLSKVHREYYRTGKLKLDKQTILDQPDGPGLEAKTVHYDYETQYPGAETIPTRMWVTNADDGPANYDYSFRCDGMGRFEKVLGPNLMFQYSYDDGSNETLRHNEVNGVDQSYDPNELNQRRKTDVLYKNAQGNNAHVVETYGYWENGLMHTVTRGNKQDQFAYYLDGELNRVTYGVLQTEGPSSETPPAEDPTKEKTVDDFLALSGFDPNGALTADRTVIYNLDGAGNRTGVNDSNIGPTAYFPDNINVYRNRVGADAIDNGANHEVTSYKNVRYTYKDEYLTSVISGADSYDLAYDALGRCVKRRMNGLTKYYIYDGERPILEYGPNGNVRGKNLYGKGIDEILMRYDPTLPPQNQTYYYQQDHQGSVIYLTKPDGKLLERYRYDVFGTPTIRDGDDHLLPEGSAVSNRFMFTGREYAAAFKFYEYRARAYHPGLGRFMSEDPKLFVRHTGLGSSPHDWTFLGHPDEAEFNLFRYCGNDPIDFTDPMGLLPDTNLTTQEARNLPLPVQVGSLAVIGGLGAAGLATVLPAAMTGADATVGRAAIAAMSRSPTLARLVGATAAAFKGKQAATSGTIGTSGSSTAAKSGEAVFWSGRQGANRAAAEAFAGSTGRTTLEMTPAGRALELAGGNISQWKALSAEFARNASGEINSFSGGASASGVWNTVEKPLLMQNSNVTKIIIKDAVNMSKTTIIYP